MTGITLAALAAMLVMGVMTAFALSARNEAARQRASAEGLVEYMLTDLRDKLRGVGRIDVMDGCLTQRAMEHYSGQSDLGSLPAGSLEQRARILLARMGEDYDKSGKPEQARAKFLEAHRATAASLYREPDNPDRIFAHAQSEYWVGQAAWRKRDRQATSKYWHGYAPGRPAARSRSRQGARQSGNGLCLGQSVRDLYYYQNYDLKKAVDYCRQAIRFEAVLDRAPGKTEIAMALANSYGWLAEVLVADKAFADARKAREEEQQIVHWLLARDPKNFELRFRRLWPEFGSAAIDIAAGQEQDGVRKLEALDRQFAALSREAPDNVEVKRAMARSLYAQTGALMTQDPAAARVKLQQLRGAIAAIGRTPGRSKP